MDVKAYAKVNLGLRVIGKRPDGFHNIETLFHRINLSDELSVFVDNFISLSCSEPTLPTNKDNLCWKAVELLQKELNVATGAKIHIQKNIPIGAGLGGGSSDAAAILKTLPKVWGKKVENSVLKKIALQLGSDVPFFLQNQSAYAEGRGEQLTPLTFTLPYWIVLVNPGIHVSTPWAYKALAEKRGNFFSAKKNLSEAVTQSPLQFILSSTNDFEEVVFKQHVAIGEIKKRFYELNAAHALMSGSGSSVFGLFEKESDAQNAANTFSREFFVNITEPNFIPS